MPRTRGIRRELRLAHKKVSAEIRVNASGGKYAAGLANEGYAGGYQAALRDVEAAMNGIPNYNSRYWPRTKE